MTYDKTANSQITAHFNSAEFKCKCKNKSCATTEIDHALVDILQQIRNHFGAEVTINSAYRCKKHNAAVGGAKDSFHIQGRAADIKVSGVKPKLVAQYAEHIGVKGIGLYDTFVHVDTRTKRFLWKGSAQKEVSTFGPYEGSDTMATATEARSLAVKYMTSRKKLNDYTQGGKRTYFFGYPDNQVGNTTQKGFSDCSAAVRAAIKAATGIDIGSNTSAQINNRNKKGIIVHETTGYYPDESKLLPGDCLYFKGNTSHPLDVGHVEMYIGDGKCCGHGSGTGPKISNMRDYCKGRANSKRRYFMAIRWIKDDAQPEDGAKALSYGMEGEDVKILQMNLIALGYDLGSYGADGDFGPSTQSAVIAFQENVRLNPTGIADEETIARINAALESIGDSNIDPDNLPVPILNGVTISPGTWNVRTGPGSEFASAGIVRGGEKYELVELDGWIPVIYNGEVRYIGPSAVNK